jgi:hypothetical protein
MERVMIKRSELIVALVALVAIVCMYGAWRLEEISTTQTIAMIEADAAAAAARSQALPIL